MKVLILLLTICFFNIVFSQGTFPIKIEFKVNTTFKSKKDSLKFASFYGELYEYLRPQVKQIYFIKPDSILVESYISDIKSPRSIFIRSKTGNESLDVSSGRKSKCLNPVIKKYRYLKNYSRIPDEDEIILGYNCQAWILKTKRDWNKVWVSNFKLGDTNLYSPDLILNGFAVLKRERYNKNGRIEVHKAISIVKDTNITSKDILKDHLEIDILEKYSPIESNGHIFDKPIKLGEVSPNFAYREIFSDEINDFYTLTSKSRYTIIEFWGTWCGPCLIANNKIKQLRAEYEDTYLTILSLNSRDRKIDKVKSVIQKKQMNWNHGFSTQKILSVFNKKGVYPRLVLLNNKNEVIYMGNPQLKFEEIKKILKN